MVLTYFIVSAFATTPCTLASKPFAVKCTASTLADGTTCKPACLPQYMPTVTSVSCAAGTLTPATGFSCVPKTEPAFPWKTGQCIMPNPAISGSATMSAGIYTLTALGASDAGQVAIGPMRTRGRHNQVQLSFDFLISSTSATGAGGEGFWATISAGVVPNIAAAVAPMIDGNGLVAVELDLILDSADHDPAVPHVAVLYNSEDHTDATQTALSNMWDQVDTASANLFSASTYKTITMLLTPVQSSDVVLMKLWYGGVLVARDSVSGEPSGVAGLLSSPKAIFAAVYAENSAGNVATKSVQNFMVCGAEAPTLWSKYVRVAMSQQRNCVQVWSFGDPGAKPGLWRALACPMNVPIMPLAPMQIPATTR